jgi:hypothetical protein
MAAFGVFMALFSRSPVFDGFNSQIDPVFSLSVVPRPARDGIEAPGGAIDASASAFQGWAYGVWGATVAGFGVLAAFVVRRPYRARQRWARDALVTAITLWFILDTGISALSGVWFNVAFNSVVLIALAVPVGATWREFAGGG